MSNRLMLALTITPALYFSSDPAAAESQPGGGEIAVTANLGFVSDYRFRGISLSGRDPAMQGGVDVSTPSGWFGGVWSSTIEEYGGSDVEVDLYAGYGATAGAFAYSLYVYGYVFPGGEDVNFVEFYATVGRQLGPAEVELQLAYTPDQWNVMRANVYIGARTDIALGDSPFALGLQGGFEDGAYDGKWNWEARLSYERDGLTVSAAYVDTNQGGVENAGRLGAAGAVGSVIITF